MLYVSTGTPPLLSIMIASGTCSTLKPIYVSTKDNSESAVVFPAQGPPVRQIRVIGDSLFSLPVLPVNSSSRRLDLCSMLSASKFSSELLSLIAVARFLRCSFISFECLLMLFAISSASPALSALVVGLSGDLSPFLMRSGLCGSVPAFVLSSGLLLPPSLPFDSSLAGWFYAARALADSVAFCLNKSILASIDF